MSIERTVVLYGAYDRYNYGDNLMPIVFEMFFEEWKKDERLDVNFVYASLLYSDLSKYDCLTTESISAVIPRLKRGDAIVVVGGEVLAASAGDLYLHVQNSRLAVYFFKILRKLFRESYSKYAAWKMGVKWTYPYMPDPEDLPEGVRVFYNTVGGIPPKSQHRPLSLSRYISVRDSRTHEAVSEFMESHLVPDSVLLLSRLISPSSIKKRSRKHVLDAISERPYIVVQASPYKVNFTPSELAFELDKIVSKKGVGVMLLPIGYASGHDDVIFLKKVKNLMREDSGLFYDLTVWEIMNIIVCSRGYYGTSLHGAITAMSYGVPHYCINRKVKKLVSFLETWSVAPFSKPLDAGDIFSTVSIETNVDKKRIEDAVLFAQNKIESAYADVMRTIVNEEAKIAG